MTSESGGTPWAAEVGTAPSGEAVAESLGRLTSFLARHYQTYLDTVLAIHGISSAHVTLLAYLWSGASGGTQNDIARNLGVDKGTVSRNVAALVRLGLVKQSSSNSDSRACVVELTPKGWELSEPVTALVKEWGAGVSRDLTAEESAAMLPQLERMCTRSTELVAEAHRRRPSRMRLGGAAALVGPSMLADTPAGRVSERL